jgi:hypothetical protein
VGEGAEDIPAGAVMALGYLHYLRFVHLPFESDTPDLEAAMLFFSRADDDVPRRIRVLLDEQATIDDDLDRWMWRAAETMVVARRTGDREKADLVVDMMRRARVWNKSDLAGRAAVQTFLAVALSARFKISGDPADIDRTVAAAREALPGITSRANLAAALGARYTLIGAEADLIEAIRGSASCWSALSRGSRGVPMSQPVSATHCVSPRPNSPPRTCLTSRSANADLPSTSTAPTTRMQRGTGRI